MSVIQAMREWLATCPYISSDVDDMSIDYPDVADTGYYLASTGTEAVKAYITGETQLRHGFILYAKSFTVEDANRLENSGFLEDFGDWVREQNFIRNFPDCGVEFDSIAVSNGMLFDIAEDKDMGTYQIQINALYWKKGNR